MHSDAQLVQSRLAAVQSVLAKDPTLTATQISNLTSIPRTSVNRYLVKIRNKDHRKPVKTSPQDDIRLRNESSKLATLNQKYSEALNIIEEQQQQLATLVDIGATDGRAHV